MAAFLNQIFICLLALAYSDFKNESILTSSIINGLNISWKSQPNFIDWDFDSVKGLMGVDIKQKPLGVQLQFHDVFINDLPKEFDSREKWDNCPTIKEVRDQGSCGSCWAFGAVEAMSDRICIHSDGKVNAHISAEDLLTCCKTCGAGCFGGMPGQAWTYFHKFGIVTGGPFDSNQGCLPYQIQHCEHHTTGKYQPCGKINSTPKCIQECQPNYNKSYINDKHYGQEPYYVSSKSEQIQMEIFKYGPVEAALTVYEDFLHYKSGIYYHVMGRVMGGHAIKILGWGTDKVTNADGEIEEIPFWLAVNSWNDDWGENGFFRIRRGKNECGIESMVYAALPRDSLA